MRRSRRRDDSTVKLELTGCTVTVDFKGNLFNLTDAEHKFVADLSAILQTFTDLRNSSIAAQVVKEPQHG